MIITKNYYMNGFKIFFWLPQLSTGTTLPLPISDLNENCNNSSNKFARQTTCKSLLMSTTRFLTAWKSLHNAQLLLPDFLKTLSPPKYNLLIIIFFFLIPEYCVEYKHDPQLRLQRG